MMRTVVNNRLANGRNIFIGSRSGILAENAHTRHACTVIYFNDKIRRQQIVLADSSIGGGNTGGGNTGGGGDDDGHNEGDGEEEGEILSFKEVN